MTFKRPESAPRDIMSPWCWYLKGNNGRQMTWRAESPWFMQQAMQCTTSTQDRTEGHHVAQMLVLEGQQGPPIDARPHIPCHIVCLLERHLHSIRLCLRAVKCSDQMLYQTMLQTQHIHGCSLSLSDLLKGSAFVQ